MEFTFERVSGSDLPAELADLIRLAEDPQMMEGIGTALVSMTRRAIDEPALRSAPWAPRKNKKLTHPLLRLTGELGKSPRVESFTASSVTMASDRKYFAIHQFGGPVPTRHTGFRLEGTKKQVPKQSYFQMPARPMFPIMANGKLTPMAEEEIAGVVDAWIGNWRQGGS